MFFDCLLHPTFPVDRFERETETEWLVLGYLSPPIGSPDYSAMKVLDSILGGSMKSRLFTELRDKKGLVYQVGSTYPSRLGPSIFATYIGGSPENQSSTFRLLKSLG